MIPSEQFSRLLISALKVGAHFQPRTVGLFQSRMRQEGDMFLVESLEVTNPVFALLLDETVSDFQKGEVRVPCLSQ